MNHFPALSRSPSVDGFAVPWAQEGTFRANYASGYPLVDDEFTFTPRIFTHNLIGVSTTDMNTLETFFEANRRSEIVWKNPNNDTVYYVIWEQDPQPSLDRRTDLWQVSQAFRQVSSTTITADTYGWGEYGDGIYGGSGA